MPTPSPLRLDKLVRQPGIIRNGYTASLVLDDDGLYLLETGPYLPDPGARARVGGHLGSLERAAGNAVLGKLVSSSVAKRVVKVDAGEAELDRVGYEKVPRGRRSQLLARSEITDVSRRVCGNGTVQLVVRSSRGKVVLELYAAFQQPSSLATIDEIVASLGRGAQA